MSGNGRVDGYDVASEKARIGRSDSRVEDLAGIQRARLLAAMTEVACERGEGNATVAHVVERAGVSRRTFYELFDSSEECFLATLEEGITRVSRCVLDGYDPEARWAARVRNALSALLEFFDAEPDVARVLVVESLGAGNRALERRRRALEQMIVAVEQGRTERKGNEEPPALTAEGVVGGVLAVIHARLLACPRTEEDEQRPLMELLNPLMGMIVLPYLGPAAARRELSRPAPNVERRSAGSASNPLRELEMRLTYRTVRVLMAVAVSPGASNRMVADRAGVGDQGQISKLLSRLEKLGLVSNTRLGPGRGAPNAWSLTEHGEEVHRAIAATAPVA
jgi:AcrR family transcriptional regulator/DNA-binding MarR family transcriptional regulator